MDTSWRFGHDCAYFHPKNVETNKTNSGLEMKLQIMKKNIEAMAFTKNRLEDLVTDLIRQKNVSKLIDHEEEAVFTEKEKFTKTEYEYEDISEINVKKRASKRESPKTKTKVKDRNKGVKSFIKCDNCSYFCKENSTMKKHTNTHHLLCQETMFKEDAKHSDEVFDYVDEGIKGINNEKTTSFVFSESMLDKFDV